MREGATSPFPSLLGIDVTDLREEGLIMIKLDILLFNKLQKYAENGQRRFVLSVPENSAPRDVINQLGIPSEEVYLIMRNGRTVGGRTGNIEVALENGDRVAFSGPIPYHRLYGSPVI